ncbi:Fe-S cluster assembly protein IscX [Neisseriaceae bacterium ESL0693]|nr:Fe-S cluster assembly protein IscX [Neisseriaceae bacterium ESL0693]
MKWTDVQLIAEELADNHNDIDPKNIRFTRLRELVLALPDFDDVPEHCGERILEAIQQHWIDEAEDQ